MRLEQAGISPKFYFLQLTLKNEIIAGFLRLPEALIQKAKQHFSQEVLAGT